VRTVDVAATLELPAGTDIMMPGDNLRVVIGLEDAVAIEKDSLFAIREKDRTIGAGRVLQPET
jgi:elongation factor Tu